MSEELNTEQKYLAEELERVHEVIQHTPAHWSLEQTQLYVQLMKVQELRRLNLQLDDLRQGQQTIIEALYAVARHSR